MATAKKNTPKGGTPERGGRGRKGDSNVLTPKQALFAKEYIVDLNATQAALRAGYSPKTAYSQGFDLLRKPEIQAAIEEEQKAREKRTEITADRILRELAALAFCDMKDYIEIGTDGSIRAKTWEEMPEGASRAVAKVKEVRRIMGSGEGEGKAIVLEARLEYGHHSKEKALELLMRHLGMLKDKVELTGKDGGPIESAVTIYIPDNGRGNGNG